LTKSSQEESNQFLDQEETIEPIQGKSVLGTLPKPSLPYKPSFVATPISYPLRTDKDNLKKKKTPIVLPELNSNDAYHNLSTPDLEPYTSDEEKWDDYLKEKYKTPVQKEEEEESVQKEEEEEQEEEQEFIPKKKIQKIINWEGKSLTHPNPFQEKMEDNDPILFEKDIQ
jgi:hypothetical protein